MNKIEIFIRFSFILLMAEIIKTEKDNFKMFSFSSNKKQQIGQDLTLFAIKLRNEIKMGPVSELKEKGQGLVEYAVILALIAIAVIAIMNIFGIRLVTVFDRVLCHLDPNTQLPDVKGTHATCAGYGIH